MNAGYAHSRSTVDQDNNQYLTSLKITLLKEEPNTRYVCTNQLVPVLEASILEMLQFKEVLVSVHVAVFHSCFSVPCVCQSFGFLLHMWRHPVGDWL